jgi:hypothetical protein
VEKHLPWLVPSLQAKTHVREWTLGIEAGVIFAKGQLTITFDDGRGSADPGGKSS